MGNVHRSVHRFWSGLPEPNTRWVRRVVTETQRCQVTDWTPDTLPTAARWVLDRDDVREQANCFRYWVLWQHGGLWLDHDVIPLTNLRTADRPWTAAVNGSREGSALWFPRPRHLMLAALIARAQEDTTAPAGVSLLNEVGAAFHGLVDLEHRVLPFDASGEPTAGIHDPLAVHLWATTRTTR